MSFEIIALYSRQLSNFFLKKEGIRNFLMFINYEKEFNVNYLPWLFSIIIKSKLISNIKKVFENIKCKYINENEFEMINEFLNENSIFLFFDEVFFKNC